MRDYHARGAEGLREATACVAAVRDFATLLAARKAVEAALGRAPTHAEWAAALGVAVPVLRARARASARARA